MKKKKFEKNANTTQNENNSKDEEKDIIQSIGSYHDFLIMEKKDLIKDSTLEFHSVESENNFLKDFIILQRHSKQEKSRFSDFFKEISEKEKGKEKEEKIEEPKIENSPNSIPNTQLPNSRFESYETCPIFNTNNNNLHHHSSLKNNLNFEKKFSNHFSNPNSRLPSEFGFKGHGNSFSSRSTNANTFYKTNSISSNESNIINFPGGNNINLIYNNNNNNVNNINSNIINNNSNNNFINNNFNINIINNNINYIEEEFQPDVDIKKVLSMEDKRSTIMIKNIPNKFTREKLLELIDKNFTGTYDLFILPKDGNKNRNFGYAFINFISSYSIPYFFYVFNGKKWINTNSKKVCEITYSKIQGRNELISHYPNKIIYFNNVLDIQNGNKFFIPKDYLILFRQIFPNHPIEEDNLGFVTKIPFIF